MRLAQYLLAIAALTPTLLISPAFAGDLFMKTSDFTSQPIGHYEFCQRYPGECTRHTARPKPVKLTQNIWNTILKVNETVNTGIRPATDRELYGKEEYWAYPVDAGDCEDYVLLKLQQLHAKGLPLSSLLITLVQKPNGEGHAVLTVHTDRGDFVLDNLKDKVLNWRRTPYTYLKRQSTHHAGLWVTIEKPAALFNGPVSSAR